MKNRTLTVLVFGIISIFILWMICPFIARFAVDGHLPSQKPDETATPSTVPSATETHGQETGDPKQPFTYYSVTVEDPGLRLSMHVLEIDPKNEDYQVRPVSANKTLFGYDYLSAINDKWQAIATVNGGFSHPNGLLGGLYYADQELLVPATGQYPVLLMAEGRAFIRDVTTPVWIEGGGIKLERFYFNRFPSADGIYVYTPAYGSKNRIDYAHLNAVIENGEVRGLTRQHKSFEIPKDGFLISAIGANAERKLNETLKAGMQLQLCYEILSEDEKLIGIDWAYECGSWILKDGEIIAPKSDGWVGTLETRAPRTAVGIKEDGTLVFVVADGRQKGISDGLTGQELARELLALGIRDAAFLDGGASSEMMVDGKIVNSPSAGRERMIAAAFVIIKK